MPDWFNRGAMLDASQAAVACVHKDGGAALNGDEIMGVQIAGRRYRVELEKVFFVSFCDFSEFPKMPPRSEAKHGRRNGDAHRSVKRIDGKRQFFAAKSRKDQESVVLISADEDA